MHTSLVKNIERAIEAKLIHIGFVRTPAKDLKLVKKINDETEIFLFPGVTAAGERVRIDPVIGVDNVKLRSRMRATNEPWRNTHSVCHVYLGLLGDWNRFYVTDSSEIEVIANAIAETTVEIALPLLEQFDSLEKVCALFRADINRTGTQNLSVGFAREKLALMADN